MKAFLTLFSILTVLGPVAARADDDKVCADALFEQYPVGQTLEITRAFVIPYGKWNGPQLSWNGLSCTFIAKSVNLQDSRSVQPRKLRIKLRSRHLESFSFYIDGDATLNSLSCWTNELGATIADFEKALGSTAKLTANVLPAEKCHKTIDALGDVRKAQQAVAALGSGPQTRAATEEGSCAKPASGPALIEQSAPERGRGTAIGI